MRVGANSPSLWPTIDSEMKTGTCFLPSWTAIVWPTISGKIVEVRDQVLTICFFPASFLEVIRCYLRWQSLPVFMLTAFAEGNHILRAGQLGVPKVFLKPNFEMDDLMRHIEAFSGREGVAGVSIAPERPDGFPDSSGGLVH